MLYETQAAAKFWLSCLDNGRLSPEQGAVFFQTLSQLMVMKFTEHWYEQNPLQGQGFRSMLCSKKDKNADLLLLQAAQTAGFDFFEVFAGEPNLQMWIDPRDVEIEVYGLAKRREKIFTEEPLYSDQGVYYPQQSYDSNGLYMDQNYGVQDQDMGWEYGYNTQPYENHREYPLVA